MYGGRNIATASTPGADRGAGEAAVAGEAGRSRTDHATATLAAPSRTDRFFADVADTWVARYATRPSFQERLRVVAGIVGPILARAGEPAVFDYGGGPGVFSLLCAGRARHVVNLDRSVEMLRAGAHGHAALSTVVRPFVPGGPPPGRRPGHVHYVAGTLDVLAPSADGRFDLVLAIAVLEYLDDPAWAVARLARLLKPGGSLLLTVPREQSWLRRVERLLGPVSGTLGALTGARRLNDRSYSRLRPHGDRVDWEPAIRVADLRVRQTFPLAIGPAGLRSRVTPNEAVVLRRPDRSPSEVPRIAVSSSGVRTRDV